MKIINFQSKLLSFLWLSLLSVVFAISLVGSLHASRLAHLEHFQEIDFLPSRELTNRLNVCAATLMKEPVRSHSELFSFLAADCKHLAESAFKRVSARSHALALSAIIALNENDFNGFIELLRRSQAAEPNTYWLARIRLSLWGETKNIQTFCNDEALLADLVLVRNAPERQAFDVTDICNEY